MANQIMRITLKAYDHTLVDQSAAKIVENCRKTGSEVNGPIPLPTRKEIVTILRAVHKYKDSREQFEQRTHKRIIDVVNPSPRTMDTLQRLDMPAGVYIDVQMKNDGDKSRGERKQLVTKPASARGTKAGGAAQKRAKAASKADELKTEAEAKAEEVKSGAKEVKTRAAGKAGEVKTEAMVKAGEIKAEATKKAVKAKTEAKAKADELKTEAEAKAEEVKSEVKEAKARATRKAKEVKAEVEAKAEEVKSEVKEAKIRAAKKAAEAGTEAGET